MNRHNRLQFALLGLPAVINTLAMLVVSFNSTFRSGNGYKWLIPMLAALVCLLLATLFAAKRGRDLGWPAAGTAGILVVSVVFGPVVLIPVGVLLFMPAKPGADRFGPAPDPHSLLLWPLALILAGWPWLLMVFTRLV